MSYKSIFLSLLMIPNLMVVSSGVSAVNLDPEATIYQLFDHMRAGDGAGIRALVEDGASLDRVTKAGELRKSKFDNWINWVDQQNEGDADEQIFDVVVQEFGGIATVWAPFIIHYKGDLVGCGVNQFTLAKKDDGWRIIHGIDTAHDGDCATFKESYASR